MAYIQTNGHPFQLASGLREIAEQGHFRTWLLDQFGVLHDGQKPYPGAISTLEALAGNGAKLVLLSNSSRRADVTAKKMEHLGFDPALFAGIITSGELTHQYLSQRNDKWFAALGRRCLHITWGARGAISLEGLGLEVVTDVNLADFVLVHGTEALGASDGNIEVATFEKLELLLEGAAKRWIPMIVANPDIVTVEARELKLMPGSLGLKYLEMGGKVRWMGKPDPVIYHAAQEILGESSGHVIAVGDSLMHDIKGAEAAGIQSVFIAGGIHAADLGITKTGMPPNRDALCRLLDENMVCPSYVVPLFTW